MQPPDLNTEVDWSYLREQGLAYLQQISQPLWNDFRLQDPGLTLFETLCYGLDQLQQYGKTPIAELLEAQSQGLSQQDLNENMANSMFAPEDILTTHPLTTFDLRKCLIDVEGVRNAWVVAAVNNASPLYYDLDHQRLSSEARSGSQAVYLKGLHNIRIEAEPELDISNEVLIERVRSQLYKVRNLAEDYSQITVLDSQPIYLFSKLELTPEANVEQTLAQLYFNLKKLLEPEVPKYSLGQLLVKGYAIEDIYAGPKLVNGLILNNDLGEEHRPHELHLSDLNPVILSLSGVKNIAYLAASNRIEAAREEFHEWVMPLDNSRVLRLAPIDEQPIKLYKKEQEISPDQQRVAQYLKLLDQQDEQQKLQEALISTPDSTTDTKQSFNVEQETSSPENKSLALKLPQNYGLSELGPPEGATDEHKAKIKQLKAFILMFDQLLANLMLQIQEVGAHFSLNQSASSATYLSEALQDSQEADFSELSDLTWLEQLQADPERDSERRQRLLSHLLGRFNQQFVDRLLLGMQQQDYLTAQQDYLKNLDSLTRNRARGLNLLSLDSSTLLDQHGVAQNLIHQLALSQDEQENCLLIEHILLRPQYETPLPSAYFEQLYTESVSTNVEDPYSFSISFFYTSSKGRFADLEEFASIVKQTLAALLPAHLDYNIVEVSEDQLTLLRQSYFQYLHLSYRIVSIEDSSVALIQQNEINQARVKVLKQMNLLALYGVDLHFDVNTLPIDSTEITYFPNLSPWGDIIPLFDDNGDVLSAKVQQDHWQGLPCLNEINNLSLTLPLLDNSAWSFITVLSCQSTHEMLFTLSGEVEFPLITVQIEEDQLQLYLGGKLVWQHLVSRELPHLINLVYGEDKTLDSYTLQLHLNGMVSSDPIVLYLSPQQIVTGLKFGDVSLQALLWLNYAVKGEQRLAVTNAMMQQYKLLNSEVFTLQPPLFHYDAAQQSGYKVDEEGGFLHWTSSTQIDISISPVDAINPPIIVYQAVADHTAIRLQNSGLNLHFISSENKIEALFFACSIEADGVILSKSLSDPQGIMLRAEQGNFIFNIGGIEHQVPIPAHPFSYLLIQQSQGSDEVEVVINDQYRYVLPANGATFFVQEAGLDSQQGTEQEKYSWLLGQQHADILGFSGLVMELATYPTVFSIAARQQLALFLAKKWQLDASGVDAIAQPILQLDASQQASLFMELQVEQNGDVNDRVNEWRDKRRSAAEYHLKSRFTASQSQASQQPQFIVKDQMSALEFTTNHSLNVTGLKEKNISLVVRYQANGIRPIKREELEDAFSGGLALWEYLHDQQWLTPIDETGENESGEAGKTNYDTNSATISVNAELASQGLEGQWSLLAHFIYRYLLKIRGDLDNERWAKGSALISLDSPGEYNDIGLSIGSQGVLLAGVGAQYSKEATLSAPTHQLKTVNTSAFTLDNLTGEFTLYLNSEKSSSKNLEDKANFDGIIGMKVGASYHSGVPFYGFIQEVLLFDRVLTEDEVRQITTHLNSKWQSV